MRKIKYTSQYKKDFKRESKGHYRSILDKEFLEVVKLLAMDEPLPEKHRDHALTGNWKDYRDCHVKPDLILIYKKID